ncbi:MAG: hypothetical protein IK101_01105 [Oscillospiraceae bacterium]|nr:hypothetical protein [Oscillospiraceae bacterium]
MLIPLDIVYTIYDSAPAGQYAVEVPYTAKTSSSTVYASGTATIKLDLPDNKYDSRYSSETAVILDCFYNEVFYAEDGLFHYPNRTYEFSIYRNNGQRYDITLEIGKLNVHRLGLSLKEILANRLGTIVWHVIIFLLDVLGFIVFFIDKLKSSKQRRIHYSIKT